MPTNHADPEAQQQTLNRDDAEPLFEQEISHPNRQHCAKAVTDQLEGFEQGHNRLEDFRMRILLVEALGEDRQWGFAPKAWEREAEL
jgi:hypothetical protein